MKDVRGDAEILADRVATLRQLLADLTAHVAKATSLESLHQTLVDIQWLILVRVRTSSDVGRGQRGGLP